MHAPIYPCPLTSTELQSGDGGILLHTLPSLLLIVIVPESCNKPSSIEMFKNHFWEIQVRVFVEENLISYLKKIRYFPKTS